MRASSYFYTFERYDSLFSSGEKVSDKFLKGYQNILLDISNKKWSLNTSIQTEEDIIGKAGKGFNYRLYSAYIKGTNLFNFIDFRLGRQYIFAGAGRGTIDGLYLKLKFGKDKQFHLKSFIGANTPLTYDFNDYGKLSENFSLGMQFSFYGIKDFLISLSYFTRHSKPESYFAIRYDSIFNPREVIIEIDDFESKLAGLDFTYEKKDYSLYGKLYYDINTKKFYRSELNARYNLFNKIKISATYIYKEPQISYNTIFWVFNHKQTHEIEFGLDYLWNNYYNIYARVSNVFYKDDNSLKFSCGIIHPAYGISFIKYTGYSGESDGIYGYFNYEFIPKKLSITSGLNFSSYKIDTYINSRENALSGLLGLVFRPANRLTFDIQGQFIKNRIYKFDKRILIGFSYWLFTKL